MNCVQNIAKMTLGLPVPIIIQNCWSTKKKTRWKYSSAPIPHH